MENEIIYKPKFQKARVMLFDGRDSWLYGDTRPIDKFDCKDIQLAAEWLSKCGYHKKPNHPCVWYRGYGEYALLLSGKTLREYEKGNVTLDFNGENEC